MQAFLSGLKLLECKYEITDYHELLQMHRFRPVLVIDTNMTLDVLKFGVLKR